MVIAITTKTVRTVAAALLSATVAVGCASQADPTVRVDPVAARSTPSTSTAPGLPPSPDPEPTQEPVADTDPATAEPSPIPTQEPASEATEPTEPTEPPSDEPHDDLTELPSFRVDTWPHVAWKVTLHADAASGCMWIEAEHGEYGRHVYATKFNHYYRGRFTTDPPELVQIRNGEPEVVAVAGETFINSGEIVEGRLDECHVGPENLIFKLF